MYILKSKLDAQVTPKTGSAAVAVSMFNAHGLAAPVLTGLRAGLATFGTPNRTSGIVVREAQKILCI